MFIFGLKRKWPSMEKDEVTTSIPARVNRAMQTSHASTVIHRDKANVHHLFS